MIGDSLNEKTIEELEKDYWVTPSSFQTGLVKSVFFLRKKPLIDFDSNDIRILISQNIGLKYLVPKAISRLEENVLEEALYYPGDLLSALLNIDHAFWLKDNFQRNHFVSLLKRSIPNIIDSAAINDDIKEDLINSIDRLISSFSPSM